jgi:hypothetical protein
MKTIVELTREAGGFEPTPEFLERLVELARADEREACAKEADKWSKRDDDVGAFIGKAIRARGETK